MRSMIPLGVPAGASSPMVPVTVSPGRPDSAAVASSGATPRRVGLVMARMRVLPERWNSSSGPVTPTMPIGTWAADQVGDRRPGPAIRHLDDVGRLRQRLEQLAGQVLDRADAGVGIGQLAGIGLGISDKLFEGANRH